MGTIITAATIMAMYLNSTGNLDSQYYYNADVEDGQIKTMYVYDNVGGALSGKLEYRYTYDDDGRVTSKTVFKVDPRTGRMAPQSRLTFAYTDGGYTMERSLWDHSANAFGHAGSRTEYRRVTADVVSVTEYGPAGDGSLSSVVSNMLVMAPAGGRLVAEF